MKEVEWLTCKDPRKMAKVAVECSRASDRTCRLFVAAFWGWQVPRLPRRQREDLQRRVEAVEQWVETGKLPAGFVASVSEHLIFFNENARAAVTKTIQAPNASWKTDWEEALAVQPSFLREVFGNPFRSDMCDESWLTSDVVALARGIYEEKAFDRMPILADALQDPGCANEDVLNHCRDASLAHVRGCWVLDLLLEKS